MRNRRWILCPLRADRSDCPLQLTTASNSSPDKRSQSAKLKPSRAGTNVARTIGQPAVDDLHFDKGARQQDLEIELQLLSGARLLAQGKFGPVIRFPGHQSFALPHSPDVLVRLVGSAIVRVRAGQHQHAPAVAVKFYQFGRRIETAVALTCWNDRLALRSVPQLAIVTGRPKHTTVE